MGLKSHPKVLLCEDLKSLFQSSLMWSLSPSLERVLLTSLESCLTWQLATRGWVIQRKYERSYLFQNSPLQWLNKAHIYIPAILLWQVSLTSRFPAMLACQSYFIILLLIRVDPSWIFCTLNSIFLVGEMGKWWEVLYFISCHCWVFSSQENPTSLYWFTNSSPLTRSIGQRTAKAILPYAIFDLAILSQI